MILNLSSGGNSSVKAESVEYGNTNVAQTLGDLEAKDINLTNSISAVDTKVNTVTNSVNNVAGSISGLESELTANGTRIYMDYKDGQYGYNTSASRGADTFHPFKSGSDGRLIPYLEVGTSDEAGAECSVKLNCKGCKTLHIDSIIHTNGTSYGNITFENDVHIQTQLDKPQYNYSLDISEWASTHDTIEIYIYNYKCRFNMTNIYVM